MRLAEERSEEGVGALPLRLPSSLLLPLLPLWCRCCCSGSSLDSLSPTGREEGEGLRDDEEGRR